MNVEIYYPGVWSLGDNNGDGAQTRRSLAFPQFWLFDELEQENTFDAVKYMYNPFRYKVAGVGSLEHQGRPALEVLLMWTGAAMVLRILFETEADRRAYHGILRGAGRKFASMPKKMQMDLELVQREPEPKIRVLWNY